jgi:hypothetical protein
MLGLRLFCIGLLAMTISMPAPARTLRIAPVLWPHALVYRKCLKEATDRQEADAVVACGAVRQSVTEQASAALADGGYREDMLQQMRRFEAELTISDRETQTLASKE